MYFLVLAAFLQLDTLPPKFVSKHTTLMECVADADEKNRKFAALFGQPDAKPLGLQFVCLEVKGST